MGFSDLRRDLPLIRAIEIAHSDREVTLQWSQFRRSIVELVASLVFPVGNGSKPRYDKYPDDAISHRLKVQCS